MTTELFPRCPFCNEPSCTVSQVVTASFYKDTNGKWHWRMTSADKKFYGTVIGESGKGYTDLADCKADAKVAGWETLPDQQRSP